MLPWSGLVKPESMFSKVVFPHPFGPSNVKISLFFTSRFRFSITFFSPNDLVTDSSFNHFLFPNLFCSSSLMIIRIENEMTINMMDNMTPAKGSEYNNV